MSDRPAPTEFEGRSMNDLSPLDPYVDLVVRWVAESQGGVAANGLSTAIAATFAWPAAFAEVILASVNGRRLLRPSGMSNRPARVMLSRRGQDWVDRSPSDADR